MKAKDGVVYKNHWATSLITLIPVFGKSQSHLIIFNQLRSDVENILDENLRKYEISFSKEQDGNTDVYKYLLENSNEKIELKVGVSLFSKEDEKDETIHLNVKKRGESSYLSEVFVYTKEQIRELNKGKVFLTRIRF